jgi:hypothetical protein
MIAESTGASADGREFSSLNPQTASSSAGTSARWRIESNPDLTSEVEVRFFAETPERTRVELEHRNLDRHGFGWESVRNGVDNDAGWPLYLQRYAALFERND